MTCRAPLLVPLIASCALVEPSFPQEGVTSPEDHLGRPVGTDFELADWDEVSAYYRRLAQESPRVSVETIGQSTEGRDFLAAVISSEANMGNLDAIREMTRRIADPRGLTEQDRRLVPGRPVASQRPD